MAICTWCDREMTTGSSCTVQAFHRSGVIHPLPPNHGGKGARWGLGNEHCGDCGVAPGGFHHPGCDAAECPACGHQLLSCGCRFDEDGPGRADDDDE